MSPSRAANGSDVPLYTHQNNGTYKKNVDTRESTECTKKKNTRHTVKRTPNKSDDITRSGGNKKSRERKIYIMDAHQTMGKQI